jgi:energy-converting hydrogenase Eha subunit A
MPRTVVPPAPLRRGGPEGAAVGGDGLPERLVKYVPAETLAFFVPLAPIVGRDRAALLVFVLVAGLVGTVGYLWLSGSRLPVDERPRRHFYALAGLAFLAWALGTSAVVQDLLGVDAIAAAVVLAVAVFLVPLADGLLSRRF